MADKTTISITGMSCASCAAKVEKALQHQEGVINANVNIAVEKATISYNPNEVKKEQLESTIKDLGFGVLAETKDTQKLTLLIDGMSCASCSAKVEKTLKRTGRHIKGFCKFSYIKSNH